MKGARSAEIAGDPGIVALIPFPVEFLTAVHARLRRAEPRRAAADSVFRATVLVQKGPGEWPGETRDP